MGDRERQSDRRGMHTHTHTLTHTITHTHTHNREREREESGRQRKSDRGERDEREIAGGMIPHSCLKPEATEPHPVFHCCIPMLKARMLKKPLHQSWLALSITICLALSALVLQLTPFAADSGCLKIGY